jgi:hypothetical protein
MADLTTRAGKGSPLTNAEVDANFTNLNTDKVETGLAALDAYDTTIADTAVDVFVYDTSRDSDGGAWRHRTQHTSWYNETLNTATRGSRREFPAVAVIVAEINQVTIYDGDDPSLPMWMVFTGAFNFAATGVPKTSVSALNGIVSFGTDQVSDTTGSVVIVKLLSEEVFSRRPVGSTQRGKFLGNIAQRNTSVGWDNSTDQSIVGQPVNDVAMTVLPNAPIDAATGLPVPTIAVATDGGVSVIKDDGTVVDVSGGIPNTVVFTSENKLFFDFDVVAGGSRAFRVLDIPSADTSITLSTKPTGSQYYTTATFADSYPEDVAFLDGYAAKAVENAIGFRSATSHLALIAPKPDENTKAMIAFLTSTYNTGWMNGDIKLATLSDTDDTDVTGSELVTNGTFDTDVSGWTNAQGTITYSSGEAILTRLDGGGEVIAYQNVPVTAGKLYQVTFDVISVTVNRPFAIYNEFAGNNLFQTDQTGSYAFYYLATGSIFPLYFRIRGVAPSGTTYTATIDNVSVRLAEPDRSVNGNGLAVYGTITKDPVATGADLVAYSGFSAANYLEQPYNSDLDFGTGDFCIMGWVKFDISSANRAFVLFGDASTYYSVQTRSDTGAAVFKVNDGVASVQANGSSSVFNGAWNLVCCVKTGGKLKLYTNANLDETTYTGGSLANSSGKLYVGQGPIGTGDDAQLALLRISATAPTAEQIAKIYEDEKFLFQDGAQATLYGASDAVTALAHDEVTDLLHVGTSAGRSVFQGLRRVDNTTDAVGVAISAYDDLVVED